MFRQLSILLFFCLIGLFYAEKTTYHGYRLLKLEPRTEEHIRLISEWQHDPDFDVWNKIKGINIGVDVLLSPIAYVKYKTLFDAHDIQFEIMDNNIQSKIDEEEMILRRMRNSVDGNSRVVDTYARYADIVTWLQMVAAANPNYASTKVIGTTGEGRNLVTLVLKTATAQRAVWIDCGIHAREWISPATCVGIIQKLTRDYNSGDADTVRFLSYYEVHFLPVHNPDGYEFSHTSTRLWRKNRRRNTGSTCLGVDLNRNYGYKWLVAGASTNPCSDTFAGSAANSEPETQAVINAINAQKDKWDAFLTIHSYGQWFFTPWCWTSALPADYTEQLRVAQISSNAIRSVYGTSFTSGPSGVLLYLGAGCSSDWSYGDANIKYSYTLELRPGSGTPDASFGFVLPVDRVPFVSEEMYQGLRAFFKAIAPASI